MFKHAIWLFAGIAIVSCVAYSTRQLDERFGPPAVRDRVVANVPPGDVDYWSDVKPVIEQRCVVCHACYDAPCQAKLSSIEGIERGASPEVVYDQARLRAAQPTRLFEDAHTTAGWRALGFHPILNERADTPVANRDASVMYQILALKQLNPLPNSKVLPDSFDLSLNRDQFCAKPETFDDYANQHPLWGMPYALPGLDAQRQNTLLRWLEQGATHTARAPLPAEFDTTIGNWETFLNDDSLKMQISARYLYEHLFLAHLYFPDLDNRRFFRLVRSSTPPGQPVARIATRRPFDNPGVARVYYRLVEDVGTVVAKTHMPYALDAGRMQKWQAWFVDADYTIDALPSYDEASASNPFLTFDAMPVQSRYRFLLDEAQFTIMSFIKGPVCRGQVALDVINDHFWVFFVSPDDATLPVAENFLASNGASMTMPASSGSIFDPFKYWRRYKKQEKQLLAWYDDYLTTHVDSISDMSLDIVWDGDGTNDNAALTVFRHFDNATVKKGLVGRPPKTAWLIGFPLLERIHYLLVAGYDVFGNVGHQLVTRTYMDFLRMDGETAFLMLLPEQARNQERAFWYRDAEKDAIDYMTLPRFEMTARPAIDYKSGNKKMQLYDMLRQRLAPVLPTRHDLAAIGDPAVIAALEPLTRLTGDSVTLMPQDVFVKITGSSADHFVTLLRDNAHLNITSMFGEKKFRIPEEDRMEVIPGFIGAYPNAFLVVDQSDLDRFVAAIIALRTEGDYARLLDDFGVRRTSPDFWPQSDTFVQAYRTDAPIEFGLFDYNRLENR